MALRQVSVFPLSQTFGIEQITKKPRPKSQVLWGKMLGSTTYRSRWLYKNWRWIFMSFLILDQYQPCPSWSCVCHTLEHSLFHVHSAEIFLLPLQGANLNLGEYTLSGSALHRSKWAISKNKMKLHRGSTNNPTKLVSKYMAQVAFNPDNPVSGNWKVSESITHSNSYFAFLTSVNILSISSNAEELDLMTILKHHKRYSWRCNSTANEVWITRATANECHNFLLEL